MIHVALLEFLPAAAETFRTRADRIAGEKHHLRLQIIGLDKLRLVICQFIEFLNI